MPKPKQYLFVLLDETGYVYDTVGPQSYASDEAAKQEASRLLDVTGQQPEDAVIVYAVQQIASLRRKVSTTIEED